MLHLKALNNSKLSLLEQVQRTAHRLQLFAVCMEVKKEYGLRGEERGAV